MANGQGFNLGGGDEAQQAALNAMFQPIPLPVRFTMIQQQMADSEGKPVMAILMSLTTPAGTNHYLLAPEAAAQFFAEGTKLAGASKAGIHIPGPGGGQ